MFCRVKRQQAILKKNMSTTVMVVENEVFVLEALEDILGSIGVVSIGAMSGQDGLKIFRKHHQSIDLVILDMNLPGMDGAEVLRLLRQVKPQVKVIISSGYDERDIERQLGDQPLPTILRKPFTAQMLLDRVKNELEG